MVLSVEFRLSFVIGVLAVELLLLRQEIEAYGTAGIHIVLRVKVVFEHLEHAVLLLACLLYTSTVLPAAYSSSLAIQPRR